MGGIFSKASRPRRPGAYFNWQAVAPAQVPVGVGDIVAVVFTHTWGPLEVPVPVSSYAEWLAVYGGDPNNPSGGYKAIKQVFQGEGLPGRGGAGSVVAYRLGGTAAAKAATSLQNTTPAAALKLEAKYEGSYGNNLKATVQTNSADGTKKDILIYDGTVLLETYTVLGTDTAAMAAAINASSDWVVATSLITGVALSNVAGVALGAGTSPVVGNDGSTLIAGDYTQAMTALEPQPFGILVFENLTDPTIIASLKTWVGQRNSNGQRFFAVIGGLSDETVDAANTRSTTQNSSDIVNVGGGHVVDSTLTDVNGNPISLSSAQLAPRIAGVLAHRGERQSLTFAHLYGLTLYNAATNAEILRAFDSGTVVLSVSSHPDAPVRIEKGLTTYTGGDPNKPVAVYRQTKNVATQHAIEMELTQWAESTIVGEGPVDEETRAAVLGQIGRVMTRRVDDRIIQSGWAAIVDPDPAPTDDDEFVAFVISGKFTRSVEQVFFTGRLG